MQEKTPLEKDSSFYTELEKAKNDQIEAASLYEQKKWLEAKRVYEQAVSP